MDAITYNRSIELLKHIRLVQGPLAVDGTLRKHSSLKKSLLQYQVAVLSDIENSIDNSKNIH